MTLPTKFCIVKAMAFPVVMYGCESWTIKKAEDIKKRWQEYIEELYKKDPFDPDNHDGMITHLEPDTLEC